MLENLDMQLMLSVRITFEVIDEKHFSSLFRMTKISFFATQIFGFEMKFKLAFTIFGAYNDFQKTGRSGLSLRI